MKLSKEYFTEIRKLPIKDWHTIANFHKIIKNYLKLKRIESKHKR